MLSATPLPSDAAALKAQKSPAAAHAPRPPSAGAPASDDEADARRRPVNPSSAAAQVLSHAAAVMLVAVALCVATQAQSPRAPLPPRPPRTASPSTDATSCRTRVPRQSWP